MPITVLTEGIAEQDEQAIRPAPAIEALSRQELKPAFDAVNELLKHRVILTESQEASLRKLRSLLSERMCPYSTRELDAHKEMLDNRFPDYEHWYIRCGTTVTWCDRKKNA